MRAFLILAVLILAQTNMTIAGGWEMKIGGFYKARVGAMAGDLDNEAVEALHDAEIHFKPKFNFTAPNGKKMMIGAQIEMEGTTSDGSEVSIDEYQIYTKGDFGTVRIGAADGAGGYGGSIPCLKFGCGDNGFLMNFGGSVVTAAASGTGDALKISFWNPTRDAKGKLIPEGLFYGLSFVTEGSDEDFELGLRYKVESEAFGNVTFSYGMTQQNSMDRTNWATGIRAKKQLEPSTSELKGGVVLDYAIAFVSNKNGDDQYLTLGSSYIRGPMTYNAHYGQELKVAGTDSQEQKFGVGGQYDLGKYNFVGAVLEFGQNADRSETYSALGAFVEFNF